MTQLLLSLFELHILLEVLSPLFLLPLLLLLLAFGQQLFALLSLAFFPVIFLLLSKLCPQSLQLRLQFRRPRR